ncbi:MAG TPA: hypothetical protein VK628_03560, partial [Flavitalea sp.]|nr:hypothetical protein [Flavitalea sp.]
MLRSLKKIHLLITRRPLLLILFVFLIVQLILFRYVGVFTGLEAEKYVTQGNLLYETGSLSDTKYVFYLPIILLVYCCRLLHAPYALAAIIQIALSGLSLFYFYKLASRLGNRNVAFYSSLLLAVFFPLQAWNLFLYSDSIFISLTVIYTYFVYSQGDK